MALTTGPIENVGNQPANANRVRVKILIVLLAHLLE